MCNCIKEFKMIAPEEAKHNRKLIKYANKNGFTVNISAESLKQVDKGLVSE